MTQEYFTVKGLVIRRHIVKEVCSYIVKEVCSYTKIRNFKPLIIFCDCAARFVSDLVGTLIVGFLVHGLILLLSFLFQKMDMLIFHLCKDFFSPKVAKSKVKEPTEYKNTSFYIYFAGCWFKWFWC